MTLVLRYACWSTRSPRSLWVLLLRINFTWVGVVTWGSQCRENEKNWCADSIIKCTGLSLSDEDEMTWCMCPASAAYYLTVRTWPQSVVWRWGKLCNSHAVDQLVSRCWFRSMNQVHMTHVVYNYDVRVFNEWSKNWRIASLVYHITSESTRNKIKRWV